MDVNIILFSVCVIKAILGPDYPKFFMAATISSKISTSLDTVLRNSFRLH